MDYLTIGSSLGLLDFIHFRLNPNQETSAYVGHELGKWAYLGLYRLTVEM